MEEAPDSPIRPAMETLRELDGRQFLDKLAIAIHDATSDVSVLGKKSVVRIDLTFDMLSQKGIVQPIITVEADITAKRPKTDPNRAVFFIDQDGNPTTTQTRQKGLEFSVAGGSQNEASAS